MTDERVRTGRSDRSKALRCDHRRVHPGGVMETLLPGITAQRVQTRRLTVAVLSVTGGTGPAVLFVHGNVSSSLFWQPTMLALAGQYRGPGWRGQADEALSTLAGVADRFSAGCPKIRKAVCRRLRDGGRRADSGGRACRARAG